MKTDFKVYKRKIDVYMRSALACDPSNTFFVYAWSTNAYKTCRDAVKEAEKLHPMNKFKAHFSK